MKKLILMSIMLLCLTGCNNEELYADYEHYDLKDKELQYYNCLDDEHIKRTYVVADITPENYESKLRGLYYQVDEDDYILLDKIDLYYYDEGHSRTYNAMYDNKLYVLGRPESEDIDGSVIVYTLNREEFSITGLDFDFSSLPDNIDRASQRIKNVDNNYIYFNNYSMEANAYVKCSLKDYTCKYIED